MNDTSHILAIGIDREAISLLIALVVGAMFVIAKLLEKKMAKQSEQRAEEAQSRREASSQQQQPAGRQAQQFPPARQQPGQKRYAPMPQRPAAARGAEQRPPQPPPQPVTAYQEAPAPQPAAPAPVRFQPIEPIPVRPEPVAHAPEELGQRVEQEIEHLQARLRKLDQFRRNRLAVRIPPEARAPARLSRRLAPRATEPAQAPPAPEIQLGLGDLTRARQAIVYHEIFSPPKALRPGREMWDV